jgi:methyl-accepting chemotaxis protein
MAAQIATTGEEQSSVTEEAAQTLEQSIQASRHLSKRSGGLAQVVGRFRVCSASACKETAF